MQNGKIFSSKTEGALNKGKMRLIAMVSLVLLVLLSGYAGLAYGQAETGTINGTVTDATGAVIPNAKVVVKSISTGAERPTVTDGNGYYNVSNLLPGTYSVTIEAPNLAKKEIHAEVTVGQRLEVNASLVVGATSTVVEVVGAGGVQVNTETATIGTVFDATANEQLPTLNRNPYTFAQFVGTASDGDPTGRGVGVAFNGLRSSGTNVLLDGAANNDEFTAAIGQTVPLDSVAEYSVLTNNFTAEYGRASSAVVNLATKSGSNDFHGSAYEYNRVSKLSANSFYNNANGVDKGQFTRNQFGGSAGGPILKNKLFFFGNVEWNRIRSAAQETVAVIDPAFVALAAAPTQQYFSSLGKLRANATKLTTYTLADENPCGLDDPSQSCLTTASGAAIPATTPFLDKINYSVPADAGAGNPQNEMLVVGRVDWNISDKTQLYGRYALNKSNLFAGTVSTSAYEGYDTAENIMQNNFLISVTHSFNPRWTMQNKLVFNRLNDFQPLGTAPISPGLYFNPSVATDTNVGLTLELPGYLPTTPGNGIPFGGPQNFVQYYQDWSHTLGRHTLRFGGTYTYQRDNRTFGAYETPVGAFATSGGLSQDSLTRFLGGYWGWFQGAIDPQGQYPGGTVTTPVGQPSFSRSNRYNEFAFYLTDSWKLTSKFTLSLGLRYEYFGTQHNKNPQLDSNYYFGTGSNFFEQIRSGEVMLAPDSPDGELWKPSTKNFGPKVGFAYDIFGDGKTVVRGGYSIAYERNFGNVTFNVIQNPPNYAVISLVDGSDVTEGSMTVTTDPAGPLSGSGVEKTLPRVSLRAVDPKIKQSYAELTSLTLEHQFRHNLIVGLDYSSSRGIHLYDIANINKSGQGNYSLGDACTPVSKLDPVNGVTYTLPAYPCYQPKGVVVFDDGTTTGFSFGKNQLTRLNTTQYSNINYRSAGGFSRYDALVARVQMNNLAKAGLTLLANYTYGHTLDELSDTFSSSGNNFNLGYLDPFKPQVDYGNSLMDIRHRVTMAAVWDVPFAKDTHGVLKQIADGWTVAPLALFETGTPFSIFDCSWAYTSCMYAVNANGGIKRGAPSSLTATSVPDDFIYTDFYNGSTPLFDSSYRDPTTGVSDFGGYPAGMNARNAFRGPGYWNMDLGIYKSFFLGERFKLQFRGEMYNVFNHANLYLHNGNVDVSYNNYVDAYKDGHRTVQLALRLTF